MKAGKRHITLHCIRIFLMVFWLYVSLDKLWDMSHFHRSLLRQPFPAWWADVLVWWLPASELLTALAFLVPARTVVSPLSNPYLLSTGLLVVFTAYIALGVAGAYAERPCGCASVFSGLSWDLHLVINVALLGISLWGWSLCRRPRRCSVSHRRKQKTAVVPTRHEAGARLLCRQLGTALTVVVRQFLSVTRRMRFPRRFAVFPGRPVHDRTDSYAPLYRVECTAGAVRSPAPWTKGDRFHHKTR